MSKILNESLYQKQRKRFDKVNNISKEFASVYCGTTILRDSIFGVVENYAQKRESDLEILRYPFHDKELWAFTFVKKGSVFLCINSELPLCKQIFAAAHELYHIYCYVEDKNQSTIIDGSVLDSKTADDIAMTQEDLEANAFAGLLLMPDARMHEQLLIFDIDKSHIEIDDVLTLMELFALPFKAIILRLFEGQILTEVKANKMLEYDSEYINQRINITGKAKNWQLDSKGIARFGSLLENLEFNSENGFITESREESDRKYLEEIMRSL